MADKVIAKHVALGPKANSFYDPNAKIKINTREPKGLTKRQLQSPRVKKALQGGHLIFVDPTAGQKAPKVSKPEAPVESNKDKFLRLYNEGMEVGKIANAMNLDALKEVAEAYEIEVEADDTKKSIAEAIVDELDSNTDDEDNDQE